MQCCKRVWADMSCGDGYRACVRNATVERDGKHYCGQHDPVKVKARQQASDQARREKWDEEAARRSIELAAPDLLAACEHGADCLERWLAELDPEMKADDDDDVTALRVMRAAIAKARKGGRDG